jgi:putative hydrolases of HD superfamily
LSVSTSAWGSCWNENHCPDLVVNQASIIGIMTEVPNRLAGQIARFIYEMGFLKHVKRAGWSLAGVNDPESVAEHSFRTALIGFILACEEGADPGRTALLCLLHDSQESRTGDVFTLGRPYVTTANNVDVTSDQIEGFPQSTAFTLLALVQEYENGETLEARLAHEADKLECVFQAREYQAHRATDTTQWIRNCSQRVSTEAGRRLLRAAAEVSPDTWWQELGNNYNQLTKSTGRRREETNGDPGSTG